MSGLFSRLANRLPPPTVPARDRAPAAPADPQQAAEALALAREILHAVEQFVVSTPDLDTGRFLQRMRGTAAGLVPSADGPTLHLYRRWAENALASFAGLQRRYVAEREEEMWRLLETYGTAAAQGQERGSEFMDALRQSQERMGELARLPDLRAAREEIQHEIRQAQLLVEQKAREDKEQVSALGRQVARLEATLAAVRGQANFDVLTGIYHRGSFQSRFEQVLAEGKPCTLAVLDLDNFKTVNDTLGHPVGDRLLTLVAEQLRRMVRSTDVVARYGGDEFCLLSPGLDPEHLAQRLAVAVTRRHVRLEMEGRTCSALLSLSVGIASSRVGDTPESLFDRADQAMLAVKREGKGGIRLA
jgi:diguanylate cyclase (GGDEF)-like protein